jgi:hypothetical protein
LKHFASLDFWYHYRALPAEVQQFADRCFELMKANLRHPSIHLKQVGEFWSARVGLHWRAVGIGVEGESLGFGSAAMPSTTSSSDNSPR